MLVTVYQVTYPGLKQVQQYYRWHWPEPEDGKLFVESCPGCGRNLGYLANSHKCRGTLTGNPIDIRMHSGKGGRPRKQQNDSELKQYLANLDHPVIVSE